MSDSPDSSVEKALNILLQLSTASDGVTASRIASALSYPTYTVVRLLQVMKRMGFVWQERPRAPYKIGYRVLELAGNLLEGMELRQSARPFLHQLAADTGMIAYLKVKTGSEAITVDVVVPPRASPDKDEIGKRLPMHACSPGKAILAARGEDEVRQYIEQIGLAPFTSHTITDPEAFLAEMRRTNARGYAVNQAESSLGAGSIAAPIMRADGKVIAAVAISFSPSVSIIGTEREQPVAREVMEAARRISFAIGYGLDQLV